MSRPNPNNPVAPLFQTKMEIQSFSDEQVIKLEESLESKVSKAENLEQTRVDAVFHLLKQEKERRDLE